MAVLEQLQILSTAAALVSLLALIGVVGVFWLVLDAISPPSPDSQWEHLGSLNLGSITSTPNLWDAEV